MSQTNDGGPAFPIDELSVNGPGIVQQLYGISIRDYFAAKAMSALITRPQRNAGLISQGGSPEIFTFDNSSCAKVAYEMADAMLSERAKAQA